MSKKCFSYLAKALILFLAIILNVSSAKAETTGYELKFKINMPDTICYLAHYFADKQYIQDSARTDSKGVVIFKGKEKLPSGIYLFVFPNKTYFELLVDKQQVFNMECDPTNVISTMKANSSEDNFEFYEYLNFIQKQSKEIESLKTDRNIKVIAKENTDEVDKKMKGIDQTVMDYKLNYIKLHPEKFLSKIFLASQDVEIPPAPMLANGKKDSTFGYWYYKNHFFDNFDVADDRLLRTPIYQSKIASYMKNLVVQIPDSIIKEADKIIDKGASNYETYKYLVWYFTNTYETSNIMGMDAVFVHLAKKYYTKEKATWVDEASLFKIQDRAKQLDPILLGKKVRNLVLADSAGVFQSLYNVKAKFTVLFFFDPDCGHCKKTTPVLKAMYDKVKSKDVQVYAICTEVEVNKWKQYIRDYKLEWINVGDPELHNNFRHEFDISTTPQIFLLDKDKIIKAKRIDVETLQKILYGELGMEGESIQTTGPREEGH